ncbi:uncharacterized protein LOC134227063 [Armigeres subalbatus]|uniref:uncharacterized protein LOC134227063 n=1 Tax=Armigeres subalbatus TaxID=124917 RepID=UPI002ED1B488
MASFNKILVLIMISLIPKNGTEAFGWGWFWPRLTTSTTTSSTSTSGTSSIPSVYNISIGNRENTNAELTDYGTMINNLQINLARFNGTALKGEATDDQLSLAISTVLENYRNRSEAAVDSRLAWIDEVMLDIVEYAEALRRDDNNRWLKDFAENIRGKVAQLDATVRTCLEQNRIVEGIIQDVTNYSTTGCLEGRLKDLFELREAVKSNLTEFLGNVEDVEDRIEACIDPDFDDETNELYQEACVSSIILQVEMDSLKLGYTVSSLTAAVEPTLGLAKAGFLECLANLASYAFDAALELRQRINECTS